MTTNEAVKYNRIDEAPSAARNGGVEFASNKNNDEDQKIAKSDGVKSTVQSIESTACNIKPVFDSTHSSDDKYMAMHQKPADNLRTNARINIAKVCEHITM